MATHTWIFPIYQVFSSKTLTQLKENEEGNSVSLVALRVAQFIQPSPAIPRLHLEEPQAIIETLLFMFYSFHVFKTAKLKCMVK